MLKLVEVDNMNSNELLQLPVGELRRLYKLYREFAEYEWGSVVVKEKLSRMIASTPVEWVIAIRDMVSDCQRCRGTGIYSWGACVNGRMTHSGRCNRCSGKGSQDNADCRRCKVYDEYSILRAFEV